MLATWKSLNLKSKCKNVDAAIGYFMLPLQIRNKSEISFVISY